MIPCRGKNFLIFDLLSFIRFPRFIHFHSNVSQKSERKKDAFGSKTLKKIVFIS